ncbi:hypothetical protein R3P38DRAFT_3204207 [Favolaschia claudopus]|uniref:CCHC-type domain-containing protein n=1 Tax=Favolaschia claudopus TaxID=2862362 RepID=A0AAW0AQN9_9AGAR
MARLSNSENVAKIQANASAESLRTSIISEIHKAQDHITNLIQSEPSKATYAQAVKNNVRGHITTCPDPDAARRLQITVKSSNIPSDRPLHIADPFGIALAFNKAIAETVEAKDSNIISPITARSARRLKSGDFTIVLHSQNDVDTIRNNSKEWLPRLAPGAWTSIPKFDVVINGVPTSFDPSSETDVRKIEENNTEIILPYSISRARWMRHPKANFGSIIAEFRDSQSANQAIDNGLSLDHSLLSAHKLTENLTQCYKCQQYGHIAKYCKNSECCALCAGNHATKSCPSTDYHSQFCCTNCSGNHSSFDRSGPARSAEREKIDSRPANSDPHFSPYLGSTTWSEGRCD